MLAEIAKGLLLMHGHLTDPKLLKAATAPQPAAGKAATDADARSAAAPQPTPERAAACC